MVATAAAAIVSVAAAAAVAAEGMVSVATAAMGKQVLFLMPMIVLEF